MAGGDILGIGSSGIIATQSALSTTSHNIANASTPGFSRQRVELEARKPQLSGAGSIGTGVVVDNTTRIFDEFLVAEVRDTSSKSKYLDASYEFTKQVDNLLADPQAGLSPVLSEFFDAVHGVSNDPASAAARQVLLSASRNMTDRFAFINDRLEAIRNATNKDIETNIGQVNQLAQAIADVNKTIVKSREFANKEANDLLDQRDRLVEQLAEKINVRTSIQEDGRLNVFVGNGQTLVVGDIASQLVAEANEYDPTKMEVSFIGRGGKAVVTQFLTGGELGGIVKFRRDVLDPAQNELGRIAIGIAKNFNAQHKLGMDLTNRMGDDFFSSVDARSPAVLPSIYNGSDVELMAEITDSTRLTTSDYQLVYQQGQYELLRLEDDKVVGRFATLPQEIESEGLRIGQLRGTTIQEGDRFIIQPTRRASDQIKLMVDHVNRVAAASPVRVESDIDNLGDANIEVAQITPELINNPLVGVDAASATAPANSKPPFIIRFINQNQFEVLDNNGNPVKVKMAAVADDPDISLAGTTPAAAGATPATPATPASETDDRAIPATPARPRRNARNEKLEAAAAQHVVQGPVTYDINTGIELFPAEGGIDRGFKISINGEPKAGDVFRIEFNTDGFSDNSNSIKLAGLQASPLLLDGTSDFAQTYGQLVSRIGSLTHELDINRQAQNILLDQAIEAREEVSGVNLDEEAAQLVRFQNQFQANAQVIAAANQAFQSLLSAFR